MKRDGSCLVFIILVNIYSNSKNMKLFSVILAVYEDENLLLWTKNHTTLKIDYLTYYGLEYILNGFM